MTINDVRGSHAHVAVGPDHVTAAAAFGHTPGDLFLSTYADLEGEVDLAATDLVELVADPSARPLITRVCRSAREQGADVRLAIPTAADRSETEKFADVLVEAGMEIGAVTQRDGFVILDLAPLAEGHSGESSRRTTALVLAAVPSAPTAPAPAAPRAARPPSGTGQGRPRPRPRPLTMLDAVQRWRNSTKRTAAVIGTVALGLVALALLGLLAPTMRPLVSIALPLLIAIVLIGSAWVTYTVLLLARQVHRQTGRLEQMIRRDRSLARRRHDAVLKRLSGLADGQKRLFFLEEYVEAVASHSAASSARMREVVDHLVPDRDTEADTGADTGADENPDGINR